MGMGRAGRWWAVGMVVVAGAGWVPAFPPIEGRVVDSEGVPAAGALVVARLADGRTVSVYTRGDGRYELPSTAEGATTVEAWWPGRGASVPVVPAEAGELRLAGADRDRPPGSAFLERLPEGETRRRFILDCTGCHVLDGSRARVAGSPRTAEQWAQAITMMRAQFGPGTGFPIISSWPDPDVLGGWLATHLDDVPVTTPPLAGPPAPEGGSGPVLTEYPVPAPGDLPHDVAVDHDGSVLITGMFTHRLYRLDPAEGGFDLIPIPVQNANPRAIDVGPDGRWWVVLGAPGAVAERDPLGEWRVHDVGMYAHSIALDRGGRAWVNGHFTVDPELVTSIDGGSGEIRRFEIPFSGGTPSGESTIPYGLRVAPDGAVWGTQLRGNHLLRLDPETGTTELWELPVSHAGPRRPDVARDGTVWIPLYSANALARFDPVEERFTLYDFPVSGALPYVARVDPRRGTVWIGTGHGDVVASFEPLEEAWTVYPVPTRGALIRHLDVDEGTGEVWFAYGASPGIPGKILRLDPGP